MGGQQLRRSKANSPTSRALTPARVWCVTPGKIQSVFEPTGRANARPMTGSVGTGSHSNQVYADCVDLSAVENASKQQRLAFSSRLTAQHPADDARSVIHGRNHPGIVKPRRSDHAEDADDAPRSVAVGRDDGRGTGQ